METSTAAEIVAEVPDSRVEPERDGAAPEHHHQESLPKLLDIAVERFSPLVARVIACEANDLRSVQHHDPELPAYLSSELESALSDLLEALRRDPNRMRRFSDRVCRIAIHDREFWLLCQELDDCPLRILVGVVVPGDALDEEAIAAHQQGFAILASSVLAAIGGQGLTAEELHVATSAPGFAKYSSLREFSYALVNHLCNEYKCEQVSYGLVRKRGVKVVALSGCPVIKSSSPGVVLVQQAMEECLDNGDPIAYPPRESSDPEFPIHRQWSRATGASNTYSIPLAVGGQVVAVVAFRAPTSRPFNDTEVDQLNERLQPLGAMAELISRANRSFLQHAGEVATSGWQRLRQPRRIAFSVVGVALLMWLAFGRMTYHPLCDATVISSHLRHMTAPYEARLERVHVHAGDRVQAGQALVEFEAYDVQLDLDAVNAEITKAEVDIGRAFQEGDASLVALHKARIGVLQARQASLQRRIATSVLRAPLDGVVIQSHVDRQVGQMFTQGQPILEFAPDDGWEVEVAVPERIAMLIHPNQVGTFVSAASTSERVPLRIRQVDAAAAVVDDRNVFVTRAELQEDPAWVRTGMRGVARITTAKQPVSWVLFHRLIDWARLRFWI